MFGECLDVHAWVLGGCLGHSSDDEVSYSGPRRMLPPMVHVAEASACCLHPIQGLCDFRGRPQL